MAIVKVFTNCYGGLGIPGLLAIADEKKTKYGSGDFLIFLNRKRTRAKILFNKNTLLIYAKPSGEITMDELRELPAAVSGNWYAGTISEKIAKELSRPVTTVSQMARAA